MLVGITGSSGSGKSIVSQAFASRDFVIIDADKVAREIVMPGEPALKELAEVFGGDIINSDNTLNRHLLASRAFSSPENTNKLNQITLGNICRRMLQRAEQCRIDGVNCAFDAPLLFEGGLDKACDCIIAITAPVDIRIKRLATRDGLSENEIRKRIARQHDDSYYTSSANYILINDKDEAEAFREASEIVEKVIAEYLMKG